MLPSVLMTLGFAASNADGPVSFGQPPVAWTLQSRLQDWTMENRLPDATMPDRLPDWTVYPRNDWPS